MRKKMMLLKFLFRGITALLKAKKLDKKYRSTDTLEHLYNTKLVFYDLLREIRGLGKNENLH